MNTTISEQIDAVRIAMNAFFMGESLKSALNDAASTLASLNLTKDLKSDREKALEEALRVLSEFSKTWGPEWFNDDDWKKINDARNLLNQ